jgi:cytochrome d ubiquinol oxidase subunit II
MSPVWEANHVWLIFVLTVMWTAYPVALASIASTLSMALLIGGVGVLLRGAAYALRTGAAAGREQRTIDTVFGFSSVVAPFALGAAAGGIASARVPVGNAAGSLVSSWLNPTSILVGCLAVVTGAYVSAVFLCGDSIRAGEPELAERFRVRALGAGVVAGAVAIGGFFVLHADAHRIFHGLVVGRGLPALAVSVVAGTTTLALIWWRRFEPARYAAALAVASIVAGWALAQAPQLLPDLTVRQAAASHDTMVAVIVAVLAGGAILFPSLLTLFRLALGGRLGSGEDDAAGAGDAEPAVEAGGSMRAVATHPGRLARIAVALLIVGIGFTNVANAEWAHVVGAAFFLGLVVTGFRAALPLAG